MRFTFPLLFLCLGLLAGTPKPIAAQGIAFPVSPGERVNPSVDAECTVRFQNIEGGFFSLESKIGRSYVPSNLAPEFRQDGLRVLIEAVVRLDLASTHQYGDVVDLLKVQRLDNPFQGGYEGRVVRETADGARQDSTFRLSVTDFGTVFGSVQITVPGRVSPVFFEGKVDNNGRGFVRLYFESPRDESVFFRDPDGEKIPIIFLSGGRVVGGSLDGQGTLWNLRAQFVPNTSVPVPPPARP